MRGRIWCVLALRSEVSDDDIYVVSAKGEDGTVGILVTYFTNDKNVVGDKVVELDVRDMDIKESVSHVTDKHLRYTEIPVEFVDGKTTLWLSPNSVTYIELN